MSIPLATYNSKQCRSLESIQQCAALPQSWPANQCLGVQNPTHHQYFSKTGSYWWTSLLLRIGDVLIRNLVHEMVLADKRAKRDCTQTTLNTHLKQLELHINVHCKVTFRVWETRDPDGKPSGTYDWTSLMGTDMKKVIKSLPSKFSELLRPEIQRTTSQVWNVSTI